VKEKDLGRNDDKYAISSRTDPKREKSVTVTRPIGGREGKGRGKE